MKHGDPRDQKFCAAVYCQHRGYEHGKRTEDNGVCAVCDCDSFKDAPAATLPDERLDRCANCGSEDHMTAGCPTGWAPKSQPIPHLKGGPVADEKKHDAVNHPKHYTQGGIECIDAIEAALGPEGFEAFLAGQVVKYVWRYKHKNGLEDLEKANWYLDRLIKRKKAQKKAAAELGKQVKVHDAIVSASPAGVMTGIKVAGTFTSVSKGRCAKCQTLAVEVDRVGWCQECFALAAGKEGLTLCNTPSSTEHAENETFAAYCDLKKGHIDHHEGARSDGQRIGWRGNQGAVITWFITAPAAPTMQESLQDPTK